MYLTPALMHTNQQRTGVSMQIGFTDMIFKYWLKLPEHPLLRSALEKEES